MLTVSKVYHPIFRNGEHADKFRTEFPNVKINIPPISIEKDEITVAGEKEAVLKVTEYIKKSVKDIKRLPKGKSTNWPKEKARNNIQPSISNG